MKKKKILLVLQYKFPPDIDALKISKSLIKNDFECAVLAPLFDDQKEYEILDNIKVFRYKTFKQNFYDKILFKLFFFSPSWFFSIRKIIKIYDPDAIHITNIWLGKSTFAAAKSIPVVVHLLENMPAAFMYYLHFSKGISYLINRIFISYKRLLRYEKKLLVDASLIIVVAKEAYKRVLNEHKNLSKKKIFIVENLESKDFIKSIVYKKKFLNKKFFNITYIGGFGPHRGLDTIIKSFIILKNYNNKIKLNLIGAKQNNFLEYLKKLIISNNLSNFVEIIGWVEPHHVMTYIAQSDICTVPHNSNYHTDTTLPWKLTQYMLAKKPVLVSSSPPLARIVRKASSGMIFEANSPKDCARVILKMKTNQKLSIYGNNGYDFVTKKGNNWEQNSSINLIKGYRVLFKKKSEMIN